MEFVIRKASDYKFEETRTINSLAELLALREEFKADLVIGEALDDSDRMDVIIYDDYLE